MTQLEFDFVGISTEMVDEELCDNCKKEMWESEYVLRHSSLFLCHGCLDDMKSDWLERFVDRH